MKIFLQPPVVSLPKQKEYLATNMKPSCFQYRSIPYYILISQTATEAEKKKVIGSEDCLYLNIYAPLRTAQNKYYPVVIMFYGGSFASGSAEMFTEKYIIDHELVIVTFNFRNGPLGNM